MIATNNRPATGDVISRGVDDRGENVITVAVTLSHDLWEAITGHLNGGDGWCCRDVAPRAIALEVRIRVFLKDEIVNWTIFGSGEYDDLLPHDPLNEEVPF